MTENIKKFLELVSQDEELSRSFEENSKLEGGEGRQAVVKLAGEHGITLTDDDFISSDSPSAELNDDDLADVAGGHLMSWTFKPTRPLLNITATYTKASGGDDPAKDVK